MTKTNCLVRSLFENDLFKREINQEGKEIWFLRIDGETSQQDKL